MKYFTYITWQYTRKNKLDNAVAELIENNNRQIIEDERNVDFFKHQILDAIKKREAENPRCKPLKAYWGKLNDHGDLVLYGVGCLTFHIYKSERDLV